MIGQQISDPQEAQSTLLACLQIACENLAAVNDAYTVPKSFTFLPGDTANEDISQFNDLCCQGTGYVRLAQAYPSWENFPSPDQIAGSCSPMAWALPMEMGIMRCAPVGTALLIPTAAQWAVANATASADLVAMMQALCCYKESFPMDATLGTGWVPKGPSGGCLVGAMGLVTQLIGCGPVC